MKFHSGKEPEVPDLSESERRVLDQAIIDVEGPLIRPLSLMVAFLLGLGLLILFWNIDLRPLMHANQTDSDFFFGVARATSGFAILLLSLVTLVYGICVTKKIISGEYRRQGI